MKSASHRGRTLVVGMSVGLASCALLASASTAAAAPRNDDFADAVALSVG